MTSRTTDFSSTENQKMSHIKDKMVAAAEDLTCQVIMKFVLLKDVEANSHSYNDKNIVCMIT